MNFISESVMVGFKCGVALFLASTQLPKLFGIHGAHGNFWEHSGHFLKHLGETNSDLADDRRRRAGGARARQDLSQEQTGGVVRRGRAALSLRRWLGLDARGVKLLGEVPQGLPAFGLPAIALGGPERSAAAGARLLSPRRGGDGRDRPHVRREARRPARRQPGIPRARRANLAAGLGRGFPISGGMSQSLVNEGGGARTPLSGAFAAGIILVVVLFFSHLLRRLPQPVLAAIVLVAVAGLFKVSALKHLWRSDRTEFVVAMRGPRRRARARACCAA